jgi:hypothetical protein
VPRLALQLLGSVPLGGDDQMEFLNCSLWKQQWVPVGLFGRTVGPLDKAPAHHCRYFPGWPLNRGPQHAQSRAQKKQIKLSDGRGAAISHSRAAFARAATAFMRCLHARFGWWHDCETLIGEDALLGRKGTRTRAVRCRSCHPCLGRLVVRLAHRPPATDIVQCGRYSICVWPTS